MAIQSITSANTSINSTRVPTAFREFADKFNNKIVLDYGCGKYYNVTSDYVESHGGVYLAYDKYHKSIFTAVDKLFLPSVDYILCCNVLNVLSDDDVLYDVLADIRNKCKPDTYVIFQIYEGDRSGVGRVTKRDCYQRNALTLSYLPYIKAVFGTSYIKRNYIICPPAL